MDDKKGSYRSGFKLALAVSSLLAGIAVPQGLAHGKQVVETAQAAARESVSGSTSTMPMPTLTPTDSIKMAGHASHASHASHRSHRSSAL